LTMDPTDSSIIIGLLAAARRAERSQALLYRAYAASAEDQGAADVAQRFHDLHADEQHHLSRLTARILELGGRPEELPTGSPTPGSIDQWPEVIAEREVREIELYREMAAHELDPRTRALISEILEVEEHHLHELGGKWMMA